MNVGYGRKTKLFGWHNVWCWCVEWNITTLMSKSLLSVSFFWMPSSSAWSGGVVWTQTDFNTLLVVFVVSSLFVTVRNKSQMNFGTFAICWNRWCLHFFFIQIDRDGSPHCLSVCRCMLMWICDTVLYILPGIQRVECVSAKCVWDAFGSVGFSFIRGCYFFSVCVWVWVSNDAQDYNSTELESSQH